jgi:hypothetical protein
MYFNQKIKNLLAKQFSKDLWQKILVIIAIIITLPISISIFLVAILVTWIADDLKIRLIIIIDILLVAFVFLAVWFSSWLDFIPYSVNQPNSLYYLSTIAQSLAAVLALVFTISLLAIQIWAKYSLHLTRRFFNFWTLAYILLFVVSILLSIQSLNRPNIMLMKVTFSLCATCLLLLVPYFSSLRISLDVQQWLLSKRREAFRQMTKDYAPFSPMEMIADTTKSLLTNNDIEGFEQGLRILCELFETAYANKKTIIAGNTLNQIEQIAILSVANPYSPPSAVRRLVYCIEPRPTWGRRFGKNIINKTIPERPNYIEADIYVQYQDRILLTLSEIGFQSIIENRIDLERIVLESFLNSLKSKAANDSTYSFISITLTDMANKAANMHQHIILKDILVILYLCGIEFKALGLEKYAEYSAKILNVQIHDNLIKFEEIRNLSSTFFIDRYSPLSIIGEPLSRNIDKQTQQKFEKLLNVN